MGAFIGSWQADYDEAVGKGGKVLDVYGIMGRFGGLAIWVEVEEGNTTVHYSPYLDSSPGDGEHIEEDYTGPELKRVWRDPGTGRFTRPCSCDMCSFRLDEEAWIDGMTGATDWGKWDWGEAEEFIPAH